MGSINLVEIMKQSALDAVKAANPCAVVFGTVSSESPLKISVEQKMELEEDHLILTTLVSEFDVDMTVEHETENVDVNHTHIFTGVPNGGGPVSGTNDTQAITHKHEYKGRKTFTVHLGLKQDEKVILLRLQGGQKYLVLDRVR